MVGHLVFRSNHGAYPCAIIRIVAFIVLGILCSLSSSAQSCPTAIQNNQFEIKPAVCSGTVALLQGSTPTGGNGTYSYQWQVAAGSCSDDSFVPIPGATSKDYHVPSAADPQFCYRRRVVSGACTSYSSKTKVQASDRTSPSPPTVTLTQPTCQTNGGTITITSPVASNGFTFSIDGSNYTNTSGTFTGVAPGTYNVTAKHTSGCVSPARSVSISAPAPLPGGSVLPATATICSGQSQVLTASGGTTYRWYRNGTLINGVSANTYTATQAGTYRVETVQGTCIGPSANSSVVTMAASPSGSIAPANSSLCAGDSVLLTTSGGASYQWFRDGNAISGATSATYRAKQSGTYSVDIISSNGCKAKASNNATVAIINAPTGAISPATASICSGGSATLTVSGGASYQWYRNGAAINGATSATYNATQEGNYTADIISSNGCKGSSSNTAVVTVGTATATAITPGSGQLCGSNASVVLTASGGTSYQWFKDGNAISGATAATFTVTSLGVYTADIINGTCKVRATNNVIVTQVNAPTGNIAPATATICAGSSQTLTTSGGTSYQWMRDGVNIPGATSATYSATQAGVYTVMINSGSCSGQAANSATITVTAPPTGTISPATATICTGGSQVLSTSGGTSYQWYRNNVVISGATGATYTATQAGTYSVDVISSNGCKAKASNEAIVTNSAAPSGGISPASANLCTGDSVTLTTSGGASYQWFRNNSSIAGATSSTYKAKVGGTYTVEISNSNGCKAMASNQAVVTITNSPSGAISPASVTICAGGSATLTATGGASYQWYKDGAAINGATSATYNATQAGSYTADVISANGCKGTTTNSSVVSVGSAPTSTIIPASGQLCGTNASLLLTASGGTSYQWYRNGVVISGATAATYTVTTTGTYSVQIISGTCTGQATNQVVVTQGNAPTGTIAPSSATICAGASQVLTATGGTSYQWSLNNVPINGATSATYTATQAGTYSVIITNGNCSGPASNVTTITEAALPNGSITPSSAIICSGGSQVLTASGGASYQWFKNGVLINGATAPTYTATSDGTYAVDVFNSNGCKARASNEATITVSPVPAGSISPASGTLCNNGSLTLTTSGGVSYQWYRNDIAITGATGASLVVSSTGNYSVDIVNANGCKAKASNTAAITTGTAPSGSISPSSAAICSSQSVTLTATGGGSYQWFKNGTLIANATAATYQATSPGIYSVLIFSGNCNGPASNTATVTESTPLTFSLNIAQPNCTQNAGTITVTNPFGGTGNGYSYSIDGGATFQANNVFTNVQVGTYGVVMKDAAGCSSNSTQVVISPATSTVQGSVSTTSITCTQTTATATVTASGGSSPYQYSLNNGAFQTFNTFTNLTVGNHKIIVKDALGCTKEILFAVQASNSTLNAGVAITNPTCHEQTGSVQVTASGGSPGYTYSLNNGPFQASSNFSTIPIGSHKVKVRDQAGCLFEVSFDIQRTTTNPNLVIVNPSSICSNGTADLQVSSITQGSDAGLTFSYWRDSIATQPLQNPAAVSPGIYFIKATNSNGCFTTRRVVVSAFPEVTGRITITGPNTPCIGQAVVLTASTGQTYQWYKDNVLISGADSQSLTVTANGVYAVAIFDGRCAVLVRDTIRLQFRNCPVTTDPKVYVPTGFTPNNNNANDVLRPILYNVSELKYFRVFNRWGQVVFQTKEIGKGWDGKINGLPQPAEPYSWVLECVDMNGNTIRQSGRSVLIR